MAMAYFSLFWCYCRCHHEWVQYPFIMAMAMEKMGIIEPGDGIHTVVATATENSILLVAVAIAITHSLNKL